MLNMEPNKGLNQTWDHDLSQNQESDAQVTAIQVLHQLRTFHMYSLGGPGWHSRLSVRHQPGHGLSVREFVPRVRLWANGSEPGACFRFCVSLSLCPSPVHALSLSVPKIKKLKKNVEKICTVFIFQLNINEVVKKK